MGSDDCVKDVESGESGASSLRMLLKQTGYKDEWLVDVRQESGEIVVRLEDRYFFWTLFRDVLIYVLFLAALSVGMYYCMKSPPHRVELVMVPE